MTQKTQSHLFAYGSLQVPDLIRAVIGRIPESIEAKAEGYRCFTMRGYSFPGMTPDPTHSTPGRILLDLSEAELEKLDEFEGPPYIRERISLQSGDSQQKSAWAYIIPGRETAFITSNPWDLNKFIDKELSTFLRNESDSQSA